MTVAHGSIYIDPGSTVSDNVDTGLIAIVSGTVDTAIVGNYTQTYSVTDSAGNAAITLTRTINVVDVSAPVITLLGDNPMTVAQASTFTDPGVNVSDNVDTGLTAIVSGTVDTDIAGNYTLTYSVTDTKGNVADTLTRTVTVADMTAPVIALIANNSMTVAHGSIYVDPGSTVSDNVDIGLIAIVSGAVDTAIVGNYTLTYSVTDSAGNAAITVNRKVTVVDMTAPVIILNGNDVITIEAGSTFSDPGSTVTDNVDTGLSVSITGTVDDTTPGEYTITYNVSDSAGNTAITKTRTVHVVDTTSPVISLLGGTAITVGVDSVFSDPGSTITDNVDTGLIATVTGTVDTSTIGSYEISYDVSDAAGNIAVTVKRMVSVVLLTGSLETNVAGLTYTTATQSGITDSTGTFYYKSGETITFSIGNTVIGDTVIAKAVMTPFDLVVGAVLYTTSAQVHHVINDLSRKSSERLSLNKLSNILTFLQLLDDDATPDNGINIQSGIANLFSGVQINFEKSLYVFEDDKKLRVITHRAVAQGLLSTAKIKSEGYALDHFYSTQNISHNFAIKSLRISDDNADGNPSSINAYTYDVNGKRLTISTDSDADGNPNTIEIYTYDTKGNTVAISLDSDTETNPALNKITTLSYDSNGNLLAVSEDHDADGNPNRITLSTYDSNGNGVEYSYDSDTETNPAPNQLSTLTYDTDGNNLSLIRDTNADGNPNSISFYTYDANGNRLTDSNDIDADSNPNYSSTYIYDLNNNLLKHLYDSDADGNPNIINTYTYDANGNRLTQSQDTDADGTPNSIYSVTYDNNGNELTKSTDSNADGNPSSITTYTYDDNDNVLTKSYDADADGNPDRITTYSYDVSGNRLTYQYDSDADGNPNSIKTYTYDSNGNELTRSTDSDTDTNPALNEIRTYVYTNSTWIGAFFEASD
jgi:hypothetical protein